MSMHKIPLTDLELSGLKAHSLDIGTPSQLSDSFRHGVKWAIENNSDIKTDEELVSIALELADKFYMMHGYISRPDYKYYASSHPHERLMWDMACAAFDIIGSADIESALSNIEDDD